MSSPVIPEQVRQYTTTRAGRAAILDAFNNGLKLSLTHVALGDGAYDPSTLQTALNNERMRSAIAGSSISQDGVQLDLEASFGPSPAFWIREVGVFAGPTLIYVWSSPIQADFVGYKNATLTFLMGVALSVADVPSGTLTIEDTGQPIFQMIRPVRNAVAALAAAVTRMQLADVGRRLPATNTEPTIIVEPPGPPLTLPPLL